SGGGGGSPCLVSNHQRPLPASRASCSCGRPRICGSKRRAARPSPRCPPSSGGEGRRSRYGCREAGSGAQSVRAASVRPGALRFSQRRALLLREDRARPRGLRPAQGGHGQEERVRRALRAMRKAFQGGDREARDGLKEVQTARGNVQERRGGVEKRGGDLKKTRGELTKRGHEVQTARGGLTKRVGEVETARGEVTRRGGDVETARREVTKRGEDMKTAHWDVKMTAGDVETARDDEEMAPRDIDARVEAVE